MAPYPSSATAGNDDPASVTTDENDNPYEASTSNGVAHEVGQIASSDGPGVRFRTQLEWQARCS